MRLSSDASPSSVLHLLPHLTVLAVAVAESNLGPWWVTFFTDWAIAVFGFSAALAAVNTARCLPLLAASAPRPDNSPSRTNWGSSLASKGAFPHGHTQQGGGATEEAADIEQGRRTGHGLRRNPSSSSGRSGGSSGTRPRGPLGAAVHALSRAAAMAVAATATGVAAATAHGKPSRSTHSDTAPDQHQQQMRRQPAPSTSEAAEHTSSAGLTPGGDDLQATDQHCKGHGDGASRAARNSSPQRRRAEGGSAEPAESPHDRSSSEQAHPHAAILERLARAAPVGPLAAAATAVQQSAVGGEGAMGRGGGGGGSGGQQDWRAAFQPLGSHVAAGAGLTELPRSRFNSAGSADSAGGAPGMSGAGPGPEQRPQAEARAGAGAGADTMVAADSAEANEEERDGGSVGHTAPQEGGAKPSARAASGVPPTTGAAEAQDEPTVPRLQVRERGPGLCIALRPQALLIVRSPWFLSLRMVHTVLQHHRSCAGQIPGTSNRAHTPVLSPQNCSTSIVSNICHLTHTHTLSLSLSLSLMCTAIAAASAVGRAERGALLGAGGVGGDRPVRHHRVLGESQLATGGGAVFLPSCSFAHSQADNGRAARMQLGWLMNAYGQTVRGS